MMEILPCLPRQGFSGCARSWGERHSKKGGVGGRHKQTFLLPQRATEPKEPSERHDSLGQKATPTLGSAPASRAVPMSPRPLVLQLCLECVLGCVITDPKLQCLLQGKRGLFQQGGNNPWRCSALSRALLFSVWSTVAP